MIDIIYLFINVVAPGRSVSKTYFFVGYLVVLAIIAYWSKGNTKTRVGGYTMWLWMSSSISLLLSLGVYFWFVISNHISLGYSLIAAHGTFTSTSLIHNHFTKGALAFIAQYVPSGWIVNFDPGLPLLDIVPQWTLFLQSISSFSAVALSVIVFMKIKGSRFHARTKLQRSAFVAAYGMSAFLFLKGIFDGGIFDPSVSVGALFLIALLYTDRRWAAYLISAISLAMIAFMSCLYVSGYFNGDQDYIFHVYSLFVEAAVVAFFYALYILKPTRLMVLSLIFLALFIYPQVANQFERGGSYPKSINDAYVSTRHPLADRRFSQVAELRTMNVYHFTDMTGVTFDQLVEQSGFNRSYTPVTIPYVDCFPRAGFISGSLSVTSVEPLVTLSTSTNFYGYTVQPSDIAYSDHRYQYTGSVSLASCMPMELAAYVGIFQSQGIQQFVLSDFKENQNDPLNLISF